MANLGFAFDANTVQPQESFDVLPAGFYPLMITESEMKATSTGGQMLVLTLEIIEGQFKGRKIWERLNLVNNNEQAVQIAQRSLSAICHAVKEFQVQDSSQLHHKPLIAKVKVNPAANGYDASNGVAGWLEYNTENQQKCAAPASQSQPQMAQMAQPQQQQAPAQQQTAPSNGAPAWAQGS